MSASFTLNDPPPLPPGAARVLACTAAVGAHLEQLKTIIEQDPALCAELFRIGNSVFFNSGPPAKTLVRVLMVLGMRMVTCLTVCLASRNLGQNVPFEPLADFWADSLRRAAVARRLATLTQRADPQDALVVGILLNIGALLRIQQDPATLPDWTHSRESLPVERADHEISTMGTTYNVISARILEKWGLPPDLVEAITMFHSPTSALTEILRLADKVVAAYTATDSRQALHQARQKLQLQLSLKTEEIDDLLRRAPTDAQNAAAAFGIRIRRQRSWQALLNQASQALNTEAMSKEEVVLHLERASRERDNLSFQLQKALERIEQATSFDPLTGLPNVRYLEETLLRELPRLSLKSANLSVLMFDIDEVRAINDRYDYATGDQVIKGIAESVKNSIRASDLRGRIGGGTLLVALPACDQANAQLVISRIRARQNSLRFETTSGRLRPSVSLAATVLTGPIVIPDGQEGTFMRDLFDRLQKGLLQAKRKGPGQVYWLQKPWHWTDLLPWGSGPART